MEKKFNVQVHVARADEIALGMLNTLQAFWSIRTLYEGLQVADSRLVSGISYYKPSYPVCFSYSYLILFTDHNLYHLG